MKPKYFEDSLALLQALNKTGAELAEKAAKEENSLYGAIGFHIANALLGLGKNLSEEILVGLDKAKKELEDEKRNSPISRE